MLKKAKNNSPKISVVIPSFNASRFIKETLESIFNQNYPNLEVIVQDGGSKDGTVAIIRKYAKKFPKILTYVSKKDKGQADAINKGFKKTKGEIITYINTDDTYEKGAFNEIVKSFDENPEAFWFAGKGRVINGKGEEIAKAITLYKDLLLKLNSYNLLLTTNYLMQPSVFLTRKGYQKVSKFTSVDGIVMEYEAWLKLGQYSMPVIIDKVLSNFRMSGGNISATLYRKTLSKDQKVAEKYTRNKLLLFLHRINNLGRLGVVQWLH